VPVSLPRALRQIEAAKACIEWVSGDVAVTAKWDFGSVNDLVYHKLSRQDQQIFSEFNDRAEWGNFVSLPGILATIIAKPPSTMSLMPEMALLISPALTMMFEAGLWTMGS